MPSSRSNSKHHSREVQTQFGRGVANCKLGGFWSDFLEIARDPQILEVESVVKILKKSTSTSLPMFLAGE